MSKRQNFRWRYQPRNKMDVLMLDYIMKSEIRSTTEMMLLSLRAFWLPLAVARSPYEDKATKERIVTEACCTLLNQLNQIYAAVGFSLPNYLPMLNQGEFVKQSPPEESKDKSTQNSPSINEQKKAVGQFDYDIDSFSSW
ncbi:MAG: hypothetical protein WBF90_14220 [Rivularia sp. (in: cyanobacteria)]